MQMNRQPELFINVIPRLETALAQIFRAVFGEVLFLRKAMKVRHVTGRQMFVTKQYVDLGSTQGQSNG
jgi:hypothetical protein